MKNRILKLWINWISNGLLLSTTLGCTMLEDELAALAPLLDDVNYLEVINHTPFSGSTGILANQSIAILFNKEIDPSKCMGAFSIIPSITGAKQAFGSAFSFDPDDDLVDGSYTFTLSKSCEDKDNRDLRSEFTATFSVGPDASPAVQAVGLESQSCSSSFPGMGSYTGGDHTLGSCWWDTSLPRLSPTYYEFRGGDSGGGSSGSTDDCADISTDNFRMIFTQYMDTGVTIDAIRLLKQSPPSSTIKLANYIWSDCQAIYPFGCRVVTLSFAELAASCNDIGAFGTLATDGDFNLACTNCPNAVSGFPIYTLEVDTTAISTAGANMDETFIFGMEGN